MNHPSPHPPSAPRAPDDRAERELLASLRDEVTALTIDESRRGARLVLPFLLPTIYLMWVVVGEGHRASPVDIAFAACVVLIVVRLAVLQLMSAGGPELALTKWRSPALTASSWAVSGGIAAIYLTLGPSVGAAQWLTLAIISTAICAVALLSAASSLLTYAGFVTIQLTALAYALHGRGDGVLAFMPFMSAFFTGALMLIAHKNNAAVRDKILLTLRVRDFGLRDALTGLRNRAFAEAFTDKRAQQIIEQWQSRGERRPAAGRSLALMLVDLDHFKKVNDTHGHAAGDEVLASFAKVARSVVREGDVVARWGGEEFLVIMEVDQRESAHAVAERLREQVAATPVSIPGGPSIALTCSIGATIFPLDPTIPMAMTWRETLQRADASLYRAKSEGRNRTSWASRAEVAASNAAPAASAPTAYEIEVANSLRETTRPPAPMRSRMGTLRPEGPHPTLLDAA